MVHVMISYCCFYNRTEQLGIEWTKGRSIWTFVGSFDTLTLSLAMRFARRPTMISDHTRFQMAFHPSPIPGELSVIFSGEGDPVGGHKIGPAVHDYFLIHTVLSGTGSYSTGSMRYKCKAGDSFFIF